MMASECCSNIQQNELDDAVIRDCEDFMQEVEGSKKGPEALAPPMGCTTTFNNTSSESHLNLREHLSAYYSHIFPVKALFRWLGYSNDRVYLQNREFSFTLMDDIYIRYLSFENVHAFLSRIAKDVPSKIDIGAVYNSRPTERKTLAGLTFRPTERELCFDIDMTDYNDVRTCCQYYNIYTLRLNF